MGFCLPGHLGQFCGRSLVSEARSGPVPACSGEAEKQPGHSQGHFIAVKRQRVRNHSELRAKVTLPMPAAVDSLGSGIPRGGD